MKEKEQILWKNFYGEKNDFNRNEIILFYYHIVGKIARKIFNNTCGILEEYEDLISYGVVGLIHAVERFDVSQKDNFIAYAYTRIHGSIVDGVRQFDWKKRSIDKDKYKLIYMEDFLTKNKNFNKLKNKEDSPFSTLLQKEVKKNVKKAISLLEEKEKRYVYLKYYKELPNKKICKEMCISPQMVYYYSKRILKKIYFSLDKKLVEPLYVSSAS